MAFQPSHGNYVKEQRKHKKRKKRGVIMLAAIVGGVIYALADVSINDFSHVFGLNRERLRAYRLIF